MQKLLISLLILTFSQQAFCQSKSVDKLYQQYKDHPELFHLDLGGNFLGLANSFNFNLDKDLSQSLTKSMEKVMMYKFPKANSTKDLDNLVKGLKRENFELLLEAGKPSDGVAIYAKGGNRIKDLVLLVQSEELMVFEMLGDFDPELLSKFGN
ncbi:DUF4252 domain-containing protein [Pleomorphovibrio marinus]|uniref:DUF4252 domain-containing protein n=1 Tax=Pleomorphovibrio marinus TaxID=2164132 RepID=UPI000E0A6AFC|nr:DUF4252 domain-containing protein [Pleomorphovibrio marinus]